MSPDPHTFVVFGGTGDLMRRKILLAIARLRDQGAIAQGSTVIGTSRRDWTDDDYRSWARKAIGGTEADGHGFERWCDNCVFFQSIGGEGDPYQHLAERLRDIEENRGLPGNRVFYLATPPSAFEETVTGLGDAGLNRSRGWTRLVIEKPFGHDTDSARDLNALLGRHFDESQIFRIDHYLGKETVQALTVFRFANMLFESSLSNQHVDNIQITVAEDLGVGDRATYYDTSGALRDMIQNHATQLLTLIAMDAPPRFEAGPVRDEKLRALRSAKPVAIEDAVFGQYTPGEIAGEPVKGYTDEAGIHKKSETETFAALRLGVSNWRWSGVPFFLRTGKRLPKRVTEIAIVFKKPPLCLFDPVGPCEVRHNVLRLRLQPDEAIRLGFEVKIPGDGFRLEQQELEFRYADTYGALPDAYDKLIRAISEGDRTHFVRSDEVEASWELYTPLLQRRPPARPYTAGTWGPQESDELLKRHGTSWMTT